MAYAIAIAVAITALCAFLALTYYETGRGVRILGQLRAKLDERVARGAFIAAHVDWSAFTAHFVRTLAARIAHDIAHASLIVVRVIERLLTRMVKYLRSRRQQVASMQEKPRFDMRASLTQFRSQIARRGEDASEKPE